MWRQSCVEEEKLRFISLRLDGGSMTELCEVFGISRQAGYELMHRHAIGGLGCVKPQTRARLEQTHRTPEALVAALTQLRCERPSWGPKKLRAYLQGRRPDEAWPAASTIGDILKRAGLVDGRRRRRSALPRTRPFAVVAAANDLWCVDFKGWFRTGDGTRCDPLTVTDAHSRYLLECRIVAPTHDGVWPAMERLFKEHGLPRAIRSDNGPPFASTGAGGLTRLSAHWMKLGVDLERIEPGQPQQNGRHERMHATLKAEAIRPASATPAVQQARFDRFREDFNTQRPHEALGQATPHAHYRRSERAYPRHLSEPTYDIDQAVRRVRSNGCIKWGGEMIFVTEALAGEPVGVTETDVGDFIVRFIDLDLGVIERGGTRLRRFTSPRPGRGHHQPEQTRESVTHVPGL
jgi:putative transposase